MLPDSDSGIHVLVARLNPFRLFSFVDTARPFDRDARQHHGDLCTTGLLIVLPDGSCDLHPKRTGQGLIPSAVPVCRKAAAHVEHRGVLARICRERRDDPAPEAVPGATERHLIVVRAGHGTPTINVDGPAPSA